MTPVVERRRDRDRADDVFRELVRNAPELGVLVGDTWVSWLLLPFGVAIYLFEAVLIAGLQAFIFSILTAIYIGGSVESH